MKNRSRSRQILIIAAAAIAAAVLGVVFIIQAIDSVRNVQENEHKTHLLELALSVDRNLEVRLEQVNFEVEYFVNQDTTLAPALTGGGDINRAKVELSTLQPMMEKKYVAAIIALRDGEPFLCTQCGEHCTHTFPSGLQPNKPCSCCDENGKLFITSSSVSPLSGISYAVLLDPESLMRLITDSELLGGYRVGIYNERTGLCASNNGPELKTEIVTVSEAAEKKNFISIMTAGEAEQKTLTQKYGSEETGGDGEQLIAVVPSSMSSNGAFAVCVAADTDTYRYSTSSILVRVIFLSVLVFMGIAILFGLFYVNRRTNAEIREKVALLEEENRTMQEVAHNQRLQMIGTMTSGIAHEFNNMLTPIMGYSIMTMEKLPPDSDELIDNLAEIYTASERAKKLISRMSSLSRKGVEADYKLLSPDDLINRALETAAPSLPATVDVVKDLRCPGKCLLASELQMGQLLLNLVINAYQAMEQKGGKLVVRTGIEDGRVVFRVKDTGPGIAEEDMQHIFEPFYTTKEVGRGTGLGLAIVGRIVENHNGRISVKSRAGEGAEFTVSFPYKGGEEQ